MKRYFLLLLSVSAMAVLCPAQRRPSVEVLTENQSQLECSIELNKQVYLANEVLRITARVKNPTTSALTVPKIFMDGNSVFYVAPYDANGQIKLQRPISQIPEPEITDQTPIETVGPGEEKTLTFYSDEEFDGNSIVLSLKPGRFGVVFTYCGVSKDFRTVRGRLETFAEARLPRDEVYPATAEDPGETVPLYRAAYVLVHEGVSSICIDTSESFAFARTLGSRPANPATISRRIRTFRVIATTTETVTGLSMTADAMENLTLFYTTPTGQIRLDVDKNLSPR